MRYYPFAQGTGGSADFLVKTGGDPTQMAAVLKRAVASVDSSQALATEVSMETLVENSLAGRRLIVEMLEAFAALALLLAVVGIYGLISYVTAQRTNEVGVRMALGARRVDVVNLILKQALLLVALGLTIGAVLAAAVAVLLRHAFTGFGGGIAPSLVAAAAVMLAVGVLAGVIPAVRAASIDPMRALRSE
jgi:ABC-type antimicrobial peptide transport system permease subunit